LTTPVQPNALSLPNSLLRLSHRVAIFHPKSLDGDSFAAFSTVGIVAASSQGLVCQGEARETFRVGFLEVKVAHCSKIERFKAVRLAVRIRQGVLDRVFHVGYDRSAR
jgi:hypothetical protein